MRSVKARPPPPPGAKDDLDLDYEEWMNSVGTRDHIRYLLHGLGRSVPAHQELREEVEDLMIELVTAQLEIYRGEGGGR